jgi:hypothetical protein
MERMNKISDELYELQTRHDYMEYTTNEQFSLADELISALEVSEQRRRNMEEGAQ